MAGEGAAVNQPNHAAGPTARRRSDQTFFGSEGARQGFPPFRRRCAALTRAFRFRCFGQLSERPRERLSGPPEGPEPATTKVQGPGANLASHSCRPRASPWLSTARPGAPGAGDPQRHQRARKSPACCGSQCDWTSACFRHFARPRAGHAAAGRETYRTPCCPQWATARIWATPDLAPEAAAREHYPYRVYFWSRLQ
jgi:hypothetical protein